MDPVTSKFLLTNTWCGQRILIMWTAYEPSLNFSTRLTVPPGYLTSAAALALSAASPVMIVPVPGRQFSGTRPSTRWFGPDCANFCARSTPVTELKLMIANATIAIATAVFRAGRDLAACRKDIISIPEDMALTVQQALPSLRQSSIGLLLLPFVPLPFPSP